MERDEVLSESFKRELEEAKANTILDPAYRKKKLIFWIIRTIISIVLYIIFWDHDWVKWSLTLTVPLSLFSLFTITISPYLLKRKIERTMNRIGDIQKLNKESNDQYQ